ncbi:MAG: hypothetical protein R2856_15275 [Caldilineaceae bacterium]
MADGTVACRHNWLTTPPDVDVKFYDDRMEAIPFDEPTDLVAISVETYTAKRAYQIASEYRKRQIPGGDGRLPPCSAPKKWPTTPKRWWWVRPTSGRR